MSRNTRAPIKLRVHLSGLEIVRHGTDAWTWIQVWASRCDSAVGAATFAGYSGA